MPGGTPLRISTLTRRIVTAIFAISPIIGFRRISSRARHIIADRAMLESLQPDASPFTIFVSAGQAKTVQNEHDNGGAAAWRVRQTIYSDAGTLSSSCDMPRHWWTMGRTDLLFLRLPIRGRAYRCNASAEQSRRRGDQCSSGCGGTEPARMPPSMVDLSAKQSVDPNGRCVLLEQQHVWELDRAKREL